MEERLQYYEKEYNHLFIVGRIFCAKYQTTTNCLEGNIRWKRGKTLHICFFSLSLLQDRNSWMALNKRKVIYGFKLLVLVLPGFILRFLNATAPRATEKTRMLSPIMGRNMVNTKIQN